MPHKILVVDDHLEIRELVKRFLNQFDYTVLLAANGDEMESVLAKNKISLIVLDIMLPGRDGITLCKELRKNSQIPIIMLTAMQDDLDKIIALEVGADDYLSKPFNPRELLARIKAVLRRYQSIPNLEDRATTNSYYFNKWRLESATHQLYNPQGLLISLTAMEFKLLLALVTNANIVLSREHLMQMVQKREYDVYDRAIDTAISRLRKKIELNPKKPLLINTVYGGGYKFTCIVSCKPV